MSVALALRDASFHLRDLRLRLPFPFGVVTLTEVLLLHVAIDVEAPRSARGRLRSFVPHQHRVLGMIVAVPLATVPQCACCWSTAASARATACAASRATWSSEPGSGGGDQERGARAASAGVSTHTGAPSCRPSGGAAISRSCSLSPSTISTLPPKSRPSCTAWNRARPSAPTVARAARTVRHVDGVVAFQPCPPPRCPATRSERSISGGRGTSGARPTPLTQSVGRASRSVWGCPTLRS